MKDRKTWGNVKVKKDLDLQEKIHLGPKRHAFLKQLYEIPMINFYIL